MTSSVGKSEDQDPRVYFAAERTLLAWVRTGIAMMGFGFVVARFGLFLREMAAVQAIPLPPTRGVSLWAGTALVILGVTVNLAAAVKHWFTIRRLQSAQPLQFRRFSLASLIALLLALVGLLLAVYLIFGLQTHGK